MESIQEQVFAYVKKRYRKPLGREELRRHGVSTVRGPRHLPESLLEELKNRK